MDFFEEVPSIAAVEEMVRKYRAREEESKAAAENRLAGSGISPAAPGAVRLIREIADGMKEIRAVFIMLLLRRVQGESRAFRLLIAEKTRNIHITEQAYERLTGMRPPVREPDRFFIRSFCQGLRLAFLEQSAVLDNIARLNRLVSDPALLRAVRTAGDSELKSLSEINRLYSRCK